MSRISMISWLCTLVLVILSGQTIFSNDQIVNKQNNSQLLNDICPLPCECDDSKVDCSYRGLKSVPKTIPTQTTELNLEGNNLTEISQEDFSKLSNLKILRLNKNKLSNLDVLQPLNGLTELKRLWIDHNNLMEIPHEQLKLMPNLESLSIAYNRIKVIRSFSFYHQRNLEILNLQSNEIDEIEPMAFAGLESLKVLEINKNQLKQLPIALSYLHSLRELTIANNELKFLPENAFRNNTQLTILELKSNPIEDVGFTAFANLPNLKKLTLSEARKLRIFPDFKGTNTLEHLKIDRSELSFIPISLCSQVPRLKSLIVKSNRITLMPKLGSCKELRLLDLSYNRISTFDDGLSHPPFLNQTKLIDLFLGHNLFTQIPEHAFVGLSSLKVLDLVNNKITFIHNQAFAPLVSLKDLNLGQNHFPQLPISGLENLTEIKVFGNPNLVEFPEPELFPKIHSLVMSYAYHCCAFIGRTISPTENPASLQESIVWLDKEDLWNTNVTDAWPGYVNFSTKFEEFANQLWKSFAKDYVIPDNLAEYAEQYFDDYKQIYGIEDGMTAKYPVHCIPQPGPFMPCKDLFDWWTLRCGVWIVFLLALLGNGVVVVVLIFGRSKIDVPRFLVANLAAADFFMGIYLGVLAVVDATTLGEFKVYAIPWQTSWGCQLAGFFGVFSSELSVYTLAVITLERNYAITHAMHLNKRLSLKHAGYIMSVGWSFALCMAVLPLFGISDYRKFAVCLPFEIEDSFWSLAYVIFLILINGVAFMVLMGCYLRMYCAIRGSQAWNSNDSRIAKRMALLVFTDFLCWAPIAFFSLTAIAGLQLVSLEEAKVFAIFVLPLNSCANPFLYAIFTKQFKKDCVLLCKRIEESRVTRGIGRCRHSSNFSQRAAASINSEVNLKNEHLQHLVCQCGSHKPKVSIEDTIINSKNHSLGWKQKAIIWLNMNNKTIENDKPNSSVHSHISQQKREANDKGKTIRGSSFSSDNNSSDLWKSNIPLRLIDKSNQTNFPIQSIGYQSKASARGRRNSWNVTRKQSQDSNLSYSRQDSSASGTVKISRLSFSSDSSSRQTATSTLSSGSSGVAGPSGTQKQDFIAQRSSIQRSSFDKPQLFRQIAVDTEKNFVYRNQRAQSLKDKQGYLCHSCAKDLSQAQKITQFKNKELEEKFNCFYSRLAETSQEETSECQEQVVVSSDQSTADHKMDLSTQSKDTASTSLQDSITSQASSSNNNQNNNEFKTQPSIEIAPNTPKDQLEFDDEFGKGTSSLGSSNHSIKTTVHVSQENVKDANKLFISDENFMTKSLTNINKSKSDKKKLGSDNSLKRLSIRNLPSMLRSLSSQSGQFLEKKKGKLISTKTSGHRGHSVEYIPRSSSISKSFETNSEHQLSDSNLAHRRLTDFGIFNSEIDYGTGIKNGTNEKNYNLETSSEGAIKFMNSEIQNSLNDQCDVSNGQKVELQKSHEIHSPD